MQQISDNLVVLNVGDPIPTQGYEDYIKIALVGSTDLIDGGELDWYSKFIEGMSKITNRMTGINVLKNMNYLVFNCKTPPIQNGTISPENPEFCKVYSYVADACEVSDGIFVNFLKKSVNPMPLHWFSMFAQSGKMIVRSSVDYGNYGLVNMTCSRYNIPLFPGRMGNVLSILQGFFSFIPKFQEMGNNNYQLPE